MEIPFKVGKENILVRGDTANYCFEICWQVKQTDKITKKEEIIWRPKKWFSGLPACLDYVMKMKITASNVATLGQLQKELEKIREELIYTYTTDVKK